MPHILVVDDSTVDREFAAGIIRKGTGYEVEFAGSGIDALEHMDVRLPLAVVTDLKMEEMDGMALVEACHRKFPMIPVILMTAHGSENIALRALLAGAADYVPKIQLASELPEAVEKAVSLTAMDRPHERLASCLRRHELDYELPNDVMLIAPLVEQLRHVVVDLQFVDEADSLRFAKAVAEALLNAIYHGNLELKQADLDGSNAMQVIERRRGEAPYRDRHVQVVASFSAEEASITVRDEGPGFDTADLPDIHDDPSPLVEGDGRGLILVRMFMDDVRFNERGNEVTLVKRMQAVPSS